MITSIIMNIYDYSMARRHHLDGGRGDSTEHISRMRKINRSNCRDTCALCTNKTGKKNRQLTENEQ